MGLFKLLCFLIKLPVLLLGSQMNLSVIKHCINIKNKTSRNIKCTLKATNGLYCSKHYRNPIQFYSNPSILLIQTWWKRCCKKKYYSYQGPARNDYSLAKNNTDVYTFDILESIPHIYFFSFADNQKNIWAFDIRTLSYLSAKTKQIKNPYTQEVCSIHIMNKIQDRINWLKIRKYDTMYLNDSNLSIDQIWNQNVLEVFNKMEENGYIVNSDWFHNLTKEHHIEFYKKLYDIWNYRLNLTLQQKNCIVPGFKKKLFRFMPNEIIDKEEKWLKKNNLQIIEKLIYSSNDKTQKSLGVMYVLMGLCYVSDDVAEAYPWILQSII